MAKRRITVTLDEEVIDAVRRALKHELPGTTVSQWLNKLLAEKTGADEAIRERNRLELIEILEEDLKDYPTEELDAMVDAWLATAVRSNPRKARTA